MNILIRYAGGKNKISDTLIDRILKFYSVNGFDYEFREPFFGAGSIGIRLLERSKRVSNICINDFDIGMSSIWTAVLTQPEELISRLKVFTPTTDAFYDFKAKLLAWQGNEYSLELAFMKIAVHQMSYSGLGTKAGGPIGGKNQESDYSVDCRWSIPHLSKVIRRCNALFSDRNFRENRCLSSDFEVLIKESGKAFLYLDPPYYEKGPELYQFFFSEHDHFRLSHALQETDQPWLLSYDNCVAIKKIYDWAEFIEIPMNYTINTSRAKSELLITSKKYKNLLKDPNEIVDLF